MPWAADGLAAELTQSHPVNELGEASKTSAARVVARSYFWSQLWLISTNLSGS